MRCAQPARDREPIRRCTDSRTSHAWASAEARPRPQRPTRAPRPVKALMRSASELDLDARKGADSGLQKANGVFVLAVEKIVDAAVNGQMVVEIEIGRQIHGRKTGG